VQKVIQTQTRGTSDPRVRTSPTHIILFSYDRYLKLQSRVEPNLAMCPSHHPFMNAQTLEDEAKRLLEECIKTLYISKLAVPT